MLALVTTYTFVTLGYILDINCMRSFKCIIYNVMWDYVWREWKMKLVEYWSFWESIYFTIYKLEI